MKLPITLASLSFPPPPKETSTTSRHEAKIGFSLPLLSSFLPPMIPPKRLYTYSSVAALRERAKMGAKKLMASPDIVLPHLPDSIFMCFPPSVLQSVDGGRQG